MRILIVEHNQDLAGIWARFLSREGIGCSVASNRAEAYEALRGQEFDALVLDMELPDGEAIAVADFASYRRSEIPIIAVTARGFFSDSAIFELIPNARSLMRAPLRVEDMAAMVQHYGGKFAAQNIAPHARGGPDSGADAQDAPATRKVADRGSGG